MTERTRSRRRGTVLAAACGLALLIVVAVVLVPGHLPSGVVPGGLPGATTVAPSPTPRPEDQLDAPGYDPDPGAFALPAADPAAAPITASLSLEDDAVRWDGSIGLSFEATELANPAWASPGSNLDEMLAALDGPVLRFGGNSVDRRMWWTSSGEPAPDWAEATVTPEDLDRVAAAAEQADAAVTITLDLGHDDPARAADMAAHAREAFGDRLLAVSIGNEPNGFFHANQPQLAVRDASWTPEAYQAALVEHSAAIEAVAPGTPVAGPGAYDAPWWRAFAESGIPHQRALTLHWYPLWDCTGPASSIANPSVEDLVSPALRDRERQILGMGREVADAHGLPLWLEETGPTSCPGTNDTSRTHAQALWTVDHALTGAESGVERMAFHSTLQACQGGAPMSPICATGPLEQPGELLQGRSSFLALMQLSQIPEGQVLTAATSGDGRVTVHGVLGGDGSLALVVTDLRDPAGAAPVPVEVSAPALPGTDAPARWVPSAGSRLESEALDADASRLGALAPVGADLAGQSLAPAKPLTLTSRPGTSTLLVLQPLEPETSDGGTG